MFEYLLARRNFTRERFHKCLLCFGRLLLVRGGGVDLIASSV